MMSLVRAQQGEPTKRQVVRPAFFVGSLYLFPINNIIINNYVLTKMSYAKLADDREKRLSILFRREVAKIRSIARHDDCSKIGVEEVLAIVLERKKRQPSIFEFIVYRL